MVTYHHSSPRWRWLLAVVSCLAVASVLADQDEDIPHNEVKNWALKFGVDLWEFGRQFTKMNEIQRKYHDDPLEVVRKDGLILIREMASEVKNMMDFKMSAVKRIMDSAEQAALSAPSAADPLAVTSRGGGGGRRTSRRRRRRRRRRSPSDVATDNGGGGGSDDYYGGGYEDPPDAAWTRSDHFDGARVNTTRSELLTPTAVSREDPAVRSAISWSSHLEPLFASNYEMDPALSWQYFGSSAGVLRRYPAADRGPKPPDIHDFRNTRWFIEAATSPKDVAILLDVTSHSVNTASLPGATVAAILDTLGDDDFVNVYAYSAETRPAALCLGAGLVSAHADNKRVLLAALDAPGSERWTDLTGRGDVNVTRALESAFDVLYRYNRSGLGCQCNQAIVLVTDSLSVAPRDVFQRHNWPHMPVRVFAYNTGRDRTTAAEMHWMACSNKGYYAKITSAAETARKALSFVSVMARPMVMYQNDHPIQWSAVYVAGQEENGDDRLMTSVSTPVFDRRNHTVRVANLLGVVGTDVPVEQIKKLVPEYKLGVNGYSFIVNNNGHVLYHPELKPLRGKSKYTDTMKPTYTSVDLTEVELPESETSPRENHTTLLELRRDMIEQKEGETEMRVKVRYDSARRVSTRRHKYFYNPVEGSPFSLGVALPEGYGMYQLRAELEIRHSPVNVTEYFKGSNWRIHPDWVYCEYGSASTQRFATAEQRLLHFLSRAGRPGWKWMSMRPRANAAAPQPPPQQTPAGANGGSENGGGAANGGGKRQDRDQYYCDKTLLQSLVRDAAVTDALDRRAAGGPNPRLSSVHKEDKQQGYQMFGVSLSFVATRSGLLRWTEHGPGAASATSEEPPSPDSPGMRFAAAHPRPTQATWYRRAVDQHSQEPESFVFSVDFADDDDNDDNDGDDKSGGGGPLVTVAHAVFVEHKGHRAPAAVVGLQFKHAALAGHFVNITSACTGVSGACHKTCASEELDCYLLDNNGFVLLSEDSTHTGRFFGEIDGTIMDSLVQDRIFKRVAVFDYQGTCTGDSNRVAGSCVRPTHWFAAWLARWFALWAEITTLLDVVRTVTASTVSPAAAAAADRGHHELPRRHEREKRDYGNAASDNDESSMYDDYDDDDDDDDDDDFDYTPDDLGGRGHGGAGNTLYETATVPKNINGYNGGGGATGNGNGNGGGGGSNDREGSSNGHSGGAGGGGGGTPVTATGGGAGGSGRPCDLRTDLYVLQPDRLNTSGQNNPLKGKLTNCHVTGCERPFSVQKIPHSNLILLVVDTLCPCGSKQLHIRSVEAVPGGGDGSATSAECARHTSRQHLYRRRPPKCISYHPEEIEIQQCGGAHATAPAPPLVFLLLLLSACCSSPLLRDDAT